MRGEPHKVAGLLAPDLEWRFHGPPGRDHMRRVLTGMEGECHFKPLRVVDLEKWVVAEGWEDLDDVYWVHAWVVEGGIITKLREYFNTRVRIQELSARGPASGLVAGGESSGERTLWESREKASQPMPEIVLAI